MFKKIIEWLKGLFRKFVLDSGKLDEGLNNVIDMLIKRGMKASDKLKDWLEIIEEELIDEFGNIKPIAFIIEETVKAINLNWGSMIDSTKGGIKVKLEVIKNKIIEYIELKLKSNI